MRSSINKVPESDVNSTSQQMLVLSHLKEDILSRSPDQVLPCYLSDDWLHKLASDLTLLLSAIERGDESGGIAGLSAVAFIAHLLRHGDQHLAIDPYLLRRSAKAMAVELHLEQMRRVLNWIPAQADVGLLFDARLDLFEHIYSSLELH